MDVLEELGMIGVHSMESTALDKVEGQGPSFERVHRLELSGCVTQKFLLSIFDNEGRLIDGNFPARLLLHQLLSSGWELLRAEIDEAVLLQHVQHQVVG